jgi:hypothetical protein
MYPCCCGEVVPCEFFADDFNRSNSTDMGSDWTETAGDWSIDSNEAEITTTGALLLSTTVNPDGPTSHVAANVKFAASNSRARLIVAATDANNYLFADLHQNGASSVLRLYEKSGGTETLLATYGPFLSLTTGVNYSWYLCYNGSQLTTGRGTAVVSAAVTGFTGDLVGVGTGATVSGAINFDDFVANRVSESCEPCVPVGGCSVCCDDGGPFEVLLDISGISGTDEDCDNCSEIPEEYTLEWSSETLEGCFWRFTEYFCNSPCAEIDTGCAHHFIRVVLLVNSDCKPTLNWSLSSVGGSEDCTCDQCTAEADYEGSNGDWDGSCDGPITLDLVSSSDGSAGSGSTAGERCACIVTFPATITITRVA